MSDSLRPFQSILGDGPYGQPSQPQITAQIMYDVYPAAAKTARSSDERVTDYMTHRQDTFPALRGEGELTIELNDLVFRARTETEIVDLMRGRLYDTDAQRLVEPDNSPTSVFNSLLRPPSYKEAHITYQFLGTSMNRLEIDPKVATTQLTVATTGVVNFHNFMNETIPPFTPMTWAIDDVIYRRQEHDGLDVDDGSMYTQTKRRRADGTHIVKGYFRPLKYQSLRDTISKAFMQEIINAMTQKPSGPVPASTQAAAASSASAAAVEGTGAKLVATDAGQRLLSRLLTETSNLMPQIDDDANAGATLVEKLRIKLMDLGDTEAQKKEGKNVLDIFETMIMKLAQAATMHNEQIVAYSMGEVQRDSTGQLLLVPHS